MRPRFECTAAEWRGWDEPYLFRCASGHEFLLTAQALEKKGQGTCPMCRAAQSLRQLQQRAESNGVRCLSTEWTGTEGPYLFECAQGHRWQRAAGSTPGCRQCGHQSGAFARRDSQGLQRLQQAASARGGQCLSEAYTLGVELYRFRCAEGHEWETPGHSVFNGSWCPLCARIQRRSAPPDPQQELAQVREAAQAKGGTCLDQDSPGIGAYYRFRCAQGHEWSALAKRILRLGSWCRRCASAACAAKTRRKDGLKQLQAFAAERGGECVKGRRIFPIRGRSNFPTRLRCVVVV